MSFEVPIEEFHRVLPHKMLSWDKIQVIGGKNMSDTKAAQANDICQFCGKPMAIGYTLFSHDGHWLCQVCFDFETEADLLREVIKGLKVGLMTITTMSFHAAECLSEPAKGYLEEVGQVAEITSGKTAEDREELDEVRTPRDLKVLLSLERKILGQIIDDIGPCEVSSPMDMELAGFAAAGLKLIDRALKVGE